MNKKKVRCALVVCTAVLLSGALCFFPKEESVSDLFLENVEALADSEDEVTCKSDPGDVCMVGSTPVKDYDEVDGWF